MIYCAQASTVSYLISKESLDLSLSLYIYIYIYIHIIYIYISHNIYIYIYIYVCAFERFVGCLAPSSDVRACRGWLSERTTCNHSHLRISFVCLRYNCSCRCFSTAASSYVCRATSHAILKLAAQCSTRSPVERLQHAPWLCGR